MTSFNGIIQAVLELWAAVFVVFIYVSAIKKGLLEDEAGKKLRILFIGAFVMLIIEAIAYLARGHVNGFSYGAVRIFSFLHFEGVFVMLYLYYAFLRTQISESKLNNPNLYNKIVIGIGAAATFLLVYNIITKKMYSFDSYNVLQRDNLYWAYLGLILAADAVMVYVLLLHKEELSTKKMMVLLSYIILPIIAVIFLFFSFGISLGNLAMVAALVINFEFCIQDDDEEEPTLNATDDLTPFELERAHVENYVEFEQERLGDKINVEWNIHVTDFLIPPLALQILVENAIRHGISKKIEGGTVVIKTEEKIGEVLVSVGDDGRGFDVSLLNTDATHGNSAYVGLLDVKKRVKVFCNGTMEINSTPNVGTLVKLHIPR